MRRFLILDKYNTWYDWRLTLTSKDAPKPEPKTNYVKLDGAHGSLDLTESLTGEVAYDDRTYKASFMTSEGTREEREARLQEIATAMHGRKVQIVDPDDPGHYFFGRVKIKAAQNFAAYATVDIEATCEPWRYAVNETKRKVDVFGSLDVVLRNNGDKTLCPVLVVVGDLSLTFNGVTTQLTDGSYKITDIRLPHGFTVVKLNGYGKVTFVYREAKL